MSEITFFDVACRVGLDKRRNGAEPTTLLAEMDRLGVSRALVRDYAVGSWNAATSNQWIADLLKADTVNRFVGVWCILPEQCGELPPPVEFFDAMKKNRIGAITLQPFEHHWLPNRLTIGAYMDEAKTRCIPVLLDAFMHKWSDLDAFLKTFPDNVFIFTGYTGKWGIDRIFRPWMDAYPKLYFAMDGYWLPRGIQRLVERYGADRILFGSGFPQYAAGSAMLQLKQSGLNDGEICKIASLNLDNLLKGGLK